MIITKSKFSKINYTCTKDIFSIEDNLNYILLQEIILSISLVLIIILKDNINKTVFLIIISFLVLSIIGNLLKLNNSLSKKKIIEFDKNKGIVKLIDESEFTFCEIDQIQIEEYIDQAGDSVDKNYSLFLRLKNDSKIKILQFSDKDEVVMLASELSIFLDLKYSFLGHYEIEAKEWNKRVEDSRKSTISLFETKFKDKSISELNEIVNSKNYSECAVYAARNILSEIQNKNGTLI